MEFDKIKGVQLTWDSKRHFIAELSSAWGELYLLQKDLKAFVEKFLKIIKTVWDDTTFQLHYICDNCPKATNAASSAEMEAICSSCIYQQFSHALARVEDCACPALTEAQKNLSVAIELLDSIIKEFVNGKDED